MDSCRIFIILSVLAALTACGRGDDADASAAAKPEAPATPPPPAPTREELILKLDSLLADARQRWRADIDTAGATGAPGVVPPMLDVEQKTLRSWQVTNHSARSVCVRLGRVAQERNKGPWTHCPLDAFHSCLDISPGKSRRFMLDEAERAAGCVNAKLEYRVGTPLQPEPTWWTRTALEDYDRRGDRTLRVHDDWPLDRLRAEISLLEQMLAETDRAARWRRELATK